MSVQIERRKYYRTCFHAPIHVFCCDDQLNHPILAWLIDVSPAGVLVELSEVRKFAPGDSVHIQLKFRQRSDDHMCSGVVRHSDCLHGKQRLGIQLQEAENLFEFPTMMSMNSKLVELNALMHQIRSTNVNILIRGETGTGKNVLAKTIHEVCKGHDEAFVRVNCPSIPDSLFESELFGHEKGAFTDAKTSVPGYFRIAGTGTILLDEISEIQTHLQAKLLQVLEDKKFRPIGGKKLIPVRANIIATSNLDLELAVEKGLFRQDLFFRLCELTIDLPPLRERKQDIAMLAHHFLFLYSEKYRRPVRLLTTDEIRILENHPWPGNIRELENCMKQTALLNAFSAPRNSTPEKSATHAGISNTPEISKELLDKGKELLDKGKNLSQMTKSLSNHFERTVISQTLSECNCNKTLAAHQLGISYRTLLRKLDQYKLP